MSVEEDMAHLSTNPGPESFVENRKTAFKFRFAKTVLSSDLYVHMSRLMEVGLEV